MSVAVVPVAAAGQDRTVYPRPPICMRAWTAFWTQRTPTLSWPRPNLRALPACHQLRNGCEDGLLGVACQRRIVLLCEHAPGRVGQQVLGGFDGRGIPSWRSIIYRALLYSILKRAVSKYYNHGVRYLKKLDSLSDRTTDWQNVQPHASYKEDLLRNHGRKSSFWSKYKG